jgi:hypothetical protein
MPRNSSANTPPASAIGTAEHDRRRHEAAERHVEQA